MRDNKPPKNATKKAGESASLQSKHIAYFFQAPCFDDFTWILSFFKAKALSQLISTGCH
jgi:hypothetical protein